MLAPVVLLACGEDPPDAGAAQKTFETLRDEHLRNRDWGAVYDMLSVAERRRIDARVDSTREDLRKNDPELGKKYDRIAKAFGVSVAELETLTPREHFVKGTESEVRRNPEAGLLLWADAEVTEPPRVDGRRCAIVVRLPDGKRMVAWLVWEDERWRLALREPPR